MKEFGTILFIIISVAFGILALWQRQRFLRARHSHKRLWQQVFSPDDFNRIDLLLTDICDAFMISRERRYSLKPSDKLKAIYAHTAGVVDSLEYEHLMLALEKHFQVTEDVFMALLKQEATVGDLARHVARPINKETASNQAVSNL